MRDRQVTPSIFIPERGFFFFLTSVENVTVVAWCKRQLGLILRVKPEGQKGSPLIKLHFFILNIEW